MRIWQRITLHHSASPAGRWTGEGFRAVDAGEIRRWHVEERGWSDIGYHFVVLADGTVEAGRPLTRRGAHCIAGGRNGCSVGICVVGNFEDSYPTCVQMRSLLSLCRVLMKSLEIPAGNIELHNEVPGSRTLCPGKYFPGDWVRKILEGYCRV